MRFEWNPKKNRDNKEKHGLSFEEVITLFEKRYSVVVDNRNNYGEERFIATGTMDNGRVAIVVYTKRKSVFRIISARKANLRERKSFSKHREV